MCPARVHSARIPGGSGGLNEPDDGLGGRFTLGSVPGSLATPPKVHHMDRSQKRGAPRVATAGWATRRSRPPDRCHWASWRPDRTIGRRPKRGPPSYSPAVLTRARRPVVADSLVGVAALTAFVTLLWLGRGLTFFANERAVMADRTISLDSFIQSVPTSIGWASRSSSTG